MFNFLKKSQMFIPQFKEQDTPLMSEIATRDKVSFDTILGFLPDPDEILQNTGKTFEVYRKIMTDSQIRACANSRKAGTKSLLWDIDRGEENKSKEAQLIKDFYENCIDIDELNDAILNAPFFGFQPIEIIWGKVNNYILPIDLIPKNQEWFIFGSDNKLRLITLGDFIQGVELPDRKFLTPTYNDINNKYYNPYGDRLLSSCFWLATFKKTGFKWWASFVEKYGMPYIIGKLPEGQDQQREGMLEQLKKLAAGAVAVVSNDSAIEIAGATGSSTSNHYDQLIEACDKAIAKTILGQTLTTEGSDKGSGSKALGQVHFKVRDDIILGDKKIVEQTHNQLIKWIIEINFGTVDKLPKFEMYQEEDVDLNTAQRDKILKDTGVSFTKEYMMKVYGFDEEDIEISNTAPQAPIPFQKDQNLIPSVNKDNMESFAEVGEHITDRLIAQFTDKQLQDQIKGALKPVFDAIDNANDFKDISKMLDKIKPEMSNVELENQLTKVIFIASLLGGKDARDEIQK